jgi:DNA repair protein RAD5
VEEQAIDRVHRIGQTKTVIVKRMIVANSIEENLLKVQEKKKLVADSTLGSTEVSKQSRQITVEDLTMLFQD